MRSLSILCLLLISSFAFPGRCVQSPTTSPAPSKETATVAGNVLRLDTGEPLKKARVILMGNVPKGLYVFYLTDEQGHFLFENVPPGSYHLDISRSGYIEAKYGQKKLGGPGAMLTLTGGQRMTDLVFKLARAAVISGHVFDEDGEPVSKAEVLVYRASKQPGKEQLQDYQPALTNDLGEFRIFDLDPGRYYLAVNYRLEDPMRPAAPASKQMPATGYLPSYYPNTSDPSKAQTISIAPGDEIRSVDLFLRPSHLVTVSGRVINAIPAPSATAGNISLSPRAPGLAEAVRGLDDTFQLKDGIFVIHDVPPGSYLLLASWSDRETRQWHHASRPLDVGNSDLDGVTITISRGVDITGHVSWEGSPPSDLQSLHINLHSLDEGPFGFPSQMVKPDGTFQFKNVPEGTYRPIASLYGPDANAFLKAARYGTSSITAAGFAVQPGTDASLELTMSSRVAQINGVVVDANSLPAAGSTVVLIPDPPHRDTHEKYKSTTTDQNGRFNLTGLSPGDYKLFSWDSAEESDEEDPAEWLDPDWLKPYETKGESIHLDEADRKSVNLTLIETRSDSPASN
jgi:hypothetical protein